MSLVGRRFERLLVLREVKEKKTDKTTYWECLCDCGTITVVSRCNLIRRPDGKNAGTKSCGCLAREKARALWYKHGLYSGAGWKEPLRGTWSSMLERCYNSEHKAYKHYGGRGITVCDEWKVFDNFKRDMGEHPEGYSLDRINVNGNYEPSNCKWSTQKEQNNNRQKSTFVEYKGKQVTLLDLAKEYGLNLNTLRSRLYSGWTLERALTEKVRVLKSKK